MFAKLVSTLVPCFFVCLMVSTSHAKTSSLGCVPSAPLAAPVRSGWDTLLAVESVKAEHYPTVGAAKVIDATKVDLNCVYKVRYR